MSKIKQLTGFVSDNKYAFNLAGIQGFFWFAWAFGCYGTVYLQSLGITASTIGSINAVNSAIAIFACMFFGYLSDRINSVKKVYITLMVILAVLYALTPFLPVNHPYMILMFFIYYPFVNIFRGSITSLMDNLSVRTSAIKGINYGVVRSLGSFTYSIASFLVVIAINSWGIKSSFVLYGVLCIPPFFFALNAFDPKRVVENKTKQKISLAPLFKNYYYVTYLMFTSLLFIAFSAEYSFIPYLMEDLGVSSDNLGNFLAVRALTEIPLLFLGIKLRQRIKLKKLIFCGASLMGLQCFLLAFWAHDLITMMISAMVFGLGNGLIIGSVPFYLFKLAPDELKASAQTMYAAVCSISGILGNFVGGFVFEAVGGSIFYGILGSIVFLALTLFVITLLSRRHLVNPADEMN